MRASKKNRSATEHSSREFSQEEKEQLVAEYRSGALSVQEFARLKAINMWSLRYWLKKKCRPKTPRGKNKWVEVIIEDKKCAGIEIGIGRHCRIEIQEAGQIELAAALIQRMEQGL